MLKIYNSLTKQKQEFTPISPGKVGIYVCGMTVYDLCHVGHARVMVNFDFIARYFRYRGYEVNYVRNITDIDDKIIKRANENQESVQILTTRFIEEMRRDAGALNVLAPDHEPKATDNIPRMLVLIKTLFDKGHAYIGRSGDVLYDVSSFKDYGKLAHKELEDLQAGSRVAVTEDKRSPLDFVLWKMAKPNEPSWDSPWGAGRPGWHIECSAMSAECLGQPFDIHGGGADLKFPHHENEIAQSEAAFDKSLANYWVHIGFVTIDKEKMSKSLGNFFTIREVLSTYHPEIIRYFMISSHYRSPLNYSQASLTIALQALKRFYTCLRGLSVTEPLADSEYEQRYIAAMDDDFNTPVALAVLFDITHEINRLRDNEPTRAAALGALLKKLAAVLGILTDDPSTFLQYSHTNDEVDSSIIEQLIAQREVARAEKNWQLADKLRNQLVEFNIALEDSASGTIWRRE